MLGAESRDYRIEIDAVRAHDSVANEHHGWLRSRRDHFVQHGVARGAFE